MANPQHHIAGIVAPPGFAPLVELVSQIGGRLARKRRISRAKALPAVAVTGGARLYPAARIAVMIKPQAPHLRDYVRLELHTRIMIGHRLPLIGIEPLRYPAHLRMIAATVRISIELPFEITGVESRQPRRARTVPAPVEPVTSETGIFRACRRPAHRDHMPIFRKPVERRRFRISAACEQGDQGNIKQIAHHRPTFNYNALFRHVAVALMLPVLAACKPPPEQSQFMPIANAAQGKKAIESVGCGSCHVIPGVGWPQGKVGPDLAGLKDRALIAGKLPNRPDILAAYIRNAPALVPGSGMPAMPVSETEARNIAAYLYQQETP